MSDLQFARELGAEFERLEREAAAGGRRRAPRWTPRSISRRGWAPMLALGTGAAVPAVVAVLAIVLLSGRSTGTAQPGAAAALRTGFSPGGTLTRGTGDCEGSPGGSALPLVPHERTGPITSASGTVAGHRWRLEVTNGSTVQHGTANGRLVIDGRSFGLCAARRPAVAFGLIDLGARAIVYGQSLWAAPAHVTIPGVLSGSVSANVSSGGFFIAALPRPACTYRTLTVVATRDLYGRGLPPSIDAWLNGRRTIGRTTERLGTCRAGALVPVRATATRRSGRNPNAPLAYDGTAQALRAPGERTRIGLVTALRGGGHLGISVLLFEPGLARGSRFGVWLERRGSAPRLLAISTLTGHTVDADYDLPPGAADGQQIVIARPAAGRDDQVPGTVLARGRLRLPR